MNKMPYDAEDLARQILLHSRRRISQLSPALLEAIYALQEKVRPFPGPLSTDGCTLWFYPEQVVEDFRKNKDSIARQLLHVTTHCLLGHLDLRGSFEEPKAFDCTADLKAAQFAEGMCGQAFATRSGSCNSSYKDHGFLRALYQDFLNTSPRSPLLKKAADACFDDHNLWHLPLDIRQSAQGSGDSSDESSESGSGQNRANTDNSSNSESESTGQGGANGQSNAPDWQRIRQSMLNGSMGKLPGSCAGMLQENFSVPQRGMSFSTFLRRFAVPEERMLMDPDTFDVRWYHLGLEYYGDIPLLEPSELSEPPLPDDIVVALDVSGSCHGETCKRFLKETLGILRDISAGASRFRVLLLLCDTEIQQEILLETPEQVDALFDNFTVTGFGGTDFRPVFDRIAQLRSKGTLPRVRGLLYLTDGYGDYPDHPADYPTAFLIPAEDKGDLPHDTQWITRLYLNEHDFTLKEASA